MKTHAGVALGLALLSSTGFAHAGQTIASPPVLHGGGQLATTACYVRNVGTRPVSVTVQITDEAGASLTPSFQNCNTPLLPGRTCVVLAGNGGGEFTGCSATASGSAKYLRGTMESRNPNLDVRHAEDLR
jgi:hypothetical protein